MNANKLRLTGIATNIKEYSSNVVRFMLKQRVELPKKDGTFTWNQSFPIVVFDCKSAPKDGEGYEVQGYLKSEKYNDRYRTQIVASKLVADASAVFEDEKKPGPADDLVG